jgi:hypothetical protein
MTHPSNAALALTLALALGASAGAQAQAHRDPFARPALPVAASAEPQAAPSLQPQLRAILYDRAHSLANISGQILAVGDRFGDYHVARIRERSVTLVRKGATSELGLDEAGEK